MPLLLGLPDQTFADPKPDSFATRTPCTWMHPTTGRDRDCQSLDSEVLANKKTSVHRRDVRLACPQDARRDTHGSLGNHNLEFALENPGLPPFRCTSGSHLQSGLGAAE